MASKGFWPKIALFDFSRLSTLLIGTLPTFLEERFEIWNVWNFVIFGLRVLRLLSTLFMFDLVFSRFWRLRQTAIRMIFGSSDLDSPRRVSMNAIFFKPFGNQIVKFMTIYVSKPTSLTPIWVEHFSDLSIQSLGLFGIQKMCRQAFFLHTPVYVHFENCIELLEVSFASWSAYLFRISK